MLREQLESKGVTFSTETDTEVLANLVENVIMTAMEEAKEGEGAPVHTVFESAVRATMQTVRGACGALFISTIEPNTLIAVSVMSPVYIGMTNANTATIVTSESAALASAAIANDSTPDSPGGCRRGSQCDKFVSLDTGEYAVITTASADGGGPASMPSADPLAHVRIHQLDDGSTVVPIVEALRREAQQKERSKGAYETYVLRDIMSQPGAIRSTLRGRASINTNNPPIEPSPAGADATKPSVMTAEQSEEVAEVRLGGLEQICGGRRVVEWLSEASRVVIIGCGSSYNVALLGKLLIEDMARIPCQVEYGGEFHQRPALLDPIVVADGKEKRPVVLLLSQSGETGDILACTRVAKSSGALTFGICNAVNSSLARQTDAGVFLHCGEETAITSTMGFTSSVVIMMLLGLRLRQEKGLMEEGEMSKCIQELLELPDAMSTVLDRCIVEIDPIGTRFRYARNFLALGRGFNFPVAMEAALKLKELAGIHCEGYPAAEMKHGPIALIDKFMPVLVIAPKDHTYEKVVSNIREVQARQGSVICITDEANDELNDICDCVISIPATSPWLVPVHAMLVVQMLAYKIANERGMLVDSPRHQTKTI